MPVLSYEELERRAVVLIEREGPKYSVDVARVTGARVARAKHALNCLEKSGVLKSWLEASPKSGLSRRYFDLAERVAEYWVDAERGSDETGDGSQERPFQTLNGLPVMIDKRTIVHKPATGRSNEPNHS